MYIEQTESVSKYFVCPSLSSFSLSLLFVAYFVFVDTAFFLPLLLLCCDSITICTHTHTQARMHAHKIICPMCNKCGRWLMLSGNEATKAIMIDRKKLHFNERKYNELKWRKSIETLCHSFQYFQQHQRQCC